MIVCVSNNRYFHYGIYHLVAEDFPEKEVYSSDVNNVTNHSLDELIGIGAATVIIDYSYLDRTLIFSLIALKRDNADLNVIIISDSRVSLNAVENILINTAADMLIEKKSSIDKIQHFLYLKRSGQIIAHSVMNIHWAAIKKKAKLTPREIDIFPYIVSGKRNKEISRNINIGQKTVSIHRRHIYAKLKVTSLAGLFNILAVFNGTTHAGTRKHESEKTH